METLKIGFIDDAFGGGEEGFIRKSLTTQFNIQETLDNPDIIFIGEGKQKEHKAFSCIKIYVAVENRYPDYSIYDYSLTFRNIDNKRNMRLPYYVLSTDPNKLIKDNNYINIANEKRGFCSVLVTNSNKRRTGSRLRFFNELSKVRRVDSGGKALNNIGKIIPINETINFLSKYKFNICFENRVYPDYVTEKITNAMMAGCIPVYMGSHYINNEFNPKSFINVSECQR